MERRGTEGQFRYSNEREKSSPVEVRTSESTGIPLSRRGSRRLELRAELHVLILVRRTMLARLRTREDEWKRRRREREREREKEREVPGRPRCESTTKSLKCDEGGAGVTCPSRPILHRLLHVVDPSPESRPPSPRSASKFEGSEARSMTECIPSLTCAIEHLQHVRILLSERH